MWGGLRFARTAIIGRDQAGINPDVVLGQGEMHKCGELFAGSGRRIRGPSLTLNILLEKSGLLDEFRAGGSKSSGHVIGP
jgi:hypothetical protein